MEGHGSSRPRGRRTALAGMRRRSGGSSTGGDSGGGTLTLTAIVAPATFDPAGAQWGNASPFYQAVFDTLLLMKTGRHDRALLATKWRTTPTRRCSRSRSATTSRSPTAPSSTRRVVADNLVRFQKGTSPDAGNFADVKSIDPPNDTTSS